jgi:outer membrane protein assembly factor BamB
MLFERWIGKRAISDPLALLPRTHENGRFIGRFRGQCFICCRAVALIALLATSARAQTPAPAARSVKQTRSADDKTPLSLFPVAPIWSLPLNNPLTAQPGFRDAFAVFALEGEQLAAYDLERGSRLWLTNIATKVEPALSADFVFIATDDALTALALRTGQSSWAHPFDDELAAAPLVAGDRLVLATADGDVIALRASDGVEIWRRRLPRAASSRPAFTESRLFVATADSHVVALNLQSGEVVWDRRLGGVGHDILAGDDRIFLGSQDRFFYCLNAKNGDVEWRWETGADAIGLPVADDRTVYFVSYDNVLRGLNRSSGVQRWKSPLPFRPLSGPLKYRETLIVAGSSPALQAFSTRDGKSQGRVAAPSELSAPPYLFVDRMRVFPVLATISSDIVGRATVSGATRDVEPPNGSLVPLPNVEVPPLMPDPPANLGAVSALPNLIRVDLPAEP